MAQQDYYTESDSAEASTSHAIPRSAALTKLRRGASVREAPRQIQSPLVELASSPPHIASHRYSTGPTEERTQSSQLERQLERTTSILARRMAMAKLTGAAPPTAPSSYYIAPGDNFSRAPLPSLGALRERAELRIKNQGVRPVGLRRNNTVTGVGIRGFDTIEVEQERDYEPVVPQMEIEPPPIQLDRAEARSNLMRKLSARRPAANTTTVAAGTTPLAVVGRKGKARPRSNSLGELSHDWLSNRVPPIPSATTFEPIHNPPMRKSSLSRSHSPATPELFTPSFLPTRLARNASLSANTTARHIPAPLVFSQPVIAAPLSVGAFGETNFVERDMRARLQAEELAESDSGTDGGYDTSVAGTYNPKDATDGTPKLFGEFEWTPSRSTAADVQYDSEPPSPSTRTSRASSVGLRISDTGSSENIQVPFVLRRGSLPQHLLSGRFPSSMSTLSSIEAGDSRAHKTASFGIGAVEDTEIRRRGSSASSILAFAGGLHRGSEAGFAFNESRLASSLSFDSNSSGAGPSRMSFLNSIDDQSRSDSLELAEEIDVRDQSSQRGQEQERKRQSDLVAKVEKKRESGLSRWQGGAFPPPEIGYQFPSPPPGSVQRFSDDLDRNSSEIGPYDVQPEVVVVPAHTMRPHGPLRYPQRSPLSAMAQTMPASPDLARIPSPVPSTHSRTASNDSLLRLIGPMIKNPEPSLATVMARTASVRSSRSTHSDKLAIEKSPIIASPEIGKVEEEEVDEGNRSGYSSTNEMERDLSNSSSESFSFEPRQFRMPAEFLPANRILQQLDDILGTEALDSDAPSALDNPPRTLLLHAPVLQVVNANTVKDRHLFLFSDLLLIAKPIIEDDTATGQPIPSNLDNKFIIKSIVELRHLKLVATEDPMEDTGTKKRHPLLFAFVERFSTDPKRAIASLIQKGGLANDGATIANLLFRNPDLNRNQLGAYLAARENKHTFRLYIGRFRFTGVRLDDALRMILMSVRLPHNLESAEYMLSVIASQWTEANGMTGFDPSLTLSLVIAIMKLSDALHSEMSPDGNVFSFPNGAISVDDFIAAFRERDTRLLVPEDLLTRIYASVRKEKIEQASDNSMFSMTPDIEASIEPSRLPTRLTYRTPSELLTITIPEPDAKFSIKLHGTDLKFEPNVLNFAKQRSQSFRVTGSALGVRAMILIKYGANAPRYQGLPLNKAFSIERAFMQHTFQIAFVNHLDVKRKYMFSTLSPEVRTNWIRVVRDRIEASVSRPLPTSRALIAAEMVAVSVLRDALIAAEDPPPLTSFAAPSPRLNTAAPRFGTAGPLLPLLAPPRSGRLGTGTSSRSGMLGNLIRSNSISKTYAAGIGKGEADLIVENNGARKQSSYGQNRGNIKEEENPFAKAGSEIQLITEQNSLLPLVLSFLRAGVSAAPHPVSQFGTAFQHRPLTPPSPPLSSTTTSNDSYVLI